MSVSEEKKLETVSTLPLNYLPAVLKENKSGWLVEYYVEHPVHHSLVRKTKKVNHVVKRYKSKLEARRHVLKMTNNINIKLSTGWNPHFTSEDARLYTPVTEVCEKFIKEKEKEARKDTIRSYASFVGIFSRWLKNQTGIEYFSMINKLTVVKFMDYVYTERNVSVRSYNNYVKVGRVVFNWAKEKCYVKENPFEQIKTKPKTEKKRIIIQHDTREIITNYLLSSSEGKNYLTVLKLIYGALMRPKEIRQIKIENIDLQNKIIVVPSETAKNKKQRIVSITDDVIASLELLNLSAYPKSHYLIGQGLKPHVKPLPDSFLTKYWDKLRKTLNLPKEMQQYSFRDTGISEMLKSGIDPLSVKQHADHHSLEMTTIYANHADPNLAKIIREKSPTF